MERDLAISGLTLMTLGLAVLLAGSFSQESIRQAYGVTINLVALVLAGVGAALTGKGFLSRRNR